MNCAGSTNLYLNFFERFEAFELSVKLGSFSLAAQQLGTTTSQVSRRVKALEEALGTPLCLRHQNSITPTDAGVRFLSTQTPLMRSFEEFEASLTSEFIPTVMLEAPVTLGGIVFPRLLENINPLRKFLLHLSPTASPTTLPQQPHEFSVILAPEPPNDNVIALRLGSIEYICACSKEYADKHGSAQNIEQLKRHKLLRGPESSTITLDHKKCWEARKFAPAGMHSLETDLALYNAALTGAGIAIGLPLFLAYADLQSGRLRRLLPDWERPRETAWLLRSVQRFPDAVTQQFIQMVKHVWQSTSGLTA